MIAPNEFWLHLHQLAEAYAAEGVNSYERTQNIVAEFRGMPRVAQRELLRDLIQVMTHCPDLYPLVVEAAQTPELAGQPERHAG